MSNTGFYNKGSMFAKRYMPVLLDCNIAIGATGAVGTTSGPGISSVTRLSVGTYMVKFVDNYNSFFSGNAMLRQPVTGSNVAATALTPGTVYQITALGTTTQANWITAGVPAGVTAAVGVAFVAAATSSGNGTAKALGSTGITNIDFIGNTTLQLIPSGGTNMGGYVIFRCMGPTATADTAQVATDPVSGSVLYLQMYLSNSSLN